MKVAVTATGPSLDAALDPRFGRCARFVLVDTDTMDFEAVENGSSSLGGGAGIQSAQLMARKDAAFVLTGRKFNVTTGICVNKADINPELCDEIEAEAAALGIPVLGRIRYDNSVTAAQIRRMAVVESGDGPAARDIRALWARVGDRQRVPASRRPWR